MAHTLIFMALFAGAYGLYNGFVQAGYIPSAYVETCEYACDTLKINHL